MSGNQGPSKYLALLFKGLELDFSRSKGEDFSSTMFVFRGANGDPITLDKHLAAKVSEDVAKVIGDWKLDINSILFAISQQKKLISAQNQSESSYVFGASLGTELNLSNLPLVGKIIPKDQTLELKDLNIFFSTGAVPPEGVVGLRNITPEGVAKVPPMLFPGASISGEVSFGGMELSFGMASGGPNELPESSGSPDTSASKPTTQPVPEGAELTAPGITKWFKVNKTFGKVSIKRVGIRVWDKSIFFPIDAEMQLGPIKVTLMGLAVGTRLDKFQPRFSLDGLAIDYKKGKVSIAGTFFRSIDPDGTPSFYGMAMVTVPKFNIAAIGGYKKINNKHSVFLFAALKLATSVGPPFMSISGLALGFGINRRILIPSVDKVKDFPFVKAANEPENFFGQSPLAVMHQIKDYVPPSPGDMFFAFGLKFKSFEMVDSFALLVLSLGNVNRLDLLGISRMSIPAKSKKPISVAELALKATFDFDEKSLKVDAILTDASYVLSPNCKLYGGFAFYAWFGGEHAGEFVLTLGGYHPKFVPPDHYPKVPRLGFFWQIIPPLSIKGEVYFALVPGMLMAGARLEAIFEFEAQGTINLGIVTVTVGGWLKASFVAGIDFIIGWKPFFYDAHAYLLISIEAGFFVEVKVGFIKIRANLKFSLKFNTEIFIKGPKFSGLVIVDWTIVKFKIAFGPKEEPSPEPISWAEFKDSFLPADKKEALSAAVETGLSQELSKTHFVVNPADLSLNIASRVPILSATLSKKNVSGKAVGIAPMDLKSIAKSEFKASIRDVDMDEDVTDEFIFEPEISKAPCAIWGDSLKPQVSKADEMIEDLLMGFIVKPKPKRAPDLTKEVPLSDFIYEEIYHNDAFDWAKPLSKQESEEETRDWSPLQDLNDQATQNKRKDILEALGFSDEEVDLSGLENDPQSAFTEVPTIVTF